MQNHMNNKKKILVIGGGPAGLSTIKALSQTHQNQKNQLQFVCYEKQPDWSGQWNYSWRSGVDQYGQPIHSGMYNQLWTNFPKQVFQFPDYTLKQHFKQSVPSYLPRQMFRDYFMTRFEKANIRSFVKFNHVVRSVRFIENQKKFQVRAVNLKQDIQIQEFFDYVVVATGHFSTPNVPQIQGFKQFKGRITHSHDVRDFTQFKNKKVLIIGCGLSGEDIALQCYKFGAKEITLSYRNKKFFIQMPKGVDVFPLLTHIQVNTAYFPNGQKKQVDQIILCTGYLHYFPFMQEKLRLKTNNRPWPKNLYKGCVWMKNSKLFYVGMGNYLISQLIFDIKAWYIRNVIIGKLLIPDIEQQTKQFEQMSKKQLQLRGPIDVIKFVTTYARQLMILTNYTQFPIQNLIPLVEQILVDKKDLLIYRDFGYKSIITGQQAKIGNKKWLQIKDCQSQQLKEFFDFKTLKN